MTEQRFLLIKVYDLDRLIADVEMIDGKMHVISYDGQPEDFEDLRPRQAFLKALLKAKKMGLKGPLPKSEWEAVSDQELYDSLPEHLAAWCGPSVSIDHLLCNQLQNSGPASGLMPRCRNQP